MQTNEYAETLLVHFRRVESLREEALGLPAIDLNSRQLCDLELLLSRAFYPLTGYLNQEQYESVLETMRLPNGTLWPMPVCLDLPERLVAGLQPGDSLALNDGEGFLLAVLRLTDIWRPDKARHARKVYGTEDPAAHPGVQRLFDQEEEWYVGGVVEGLHLPLHYDFTELRLTPPETHRRFYQNGWRKVLAYHTDGFIHREQHEMVVRAARSVGANIFLQPMVGPESMDGMDHFTKVRCYAKSRERFPKNMTMLSLLPYAPRAAGPREALWQAIIRKNYGCSHFMVGPTHADPFSGSEKPYYPVGAAQALVREYAAESGIEMVAMEPLRYVEERAQFLPMTAIDPEMTIKEMTHAELRRRLEKDLAIPEWFSYPEIVEELRYAFPPRSRQGFTVFFTGLSGSGKSTLARVLFIKFMEMRDRPVTLLDGDIVRKNLSSELSFSKEHRNLNITRIGFVASEITKNGGIAICAPIAPYEESRRANRELISRYGGYIEVHVATPLATCEARDRKGLYAKARAGKVKGVTGVSDPYITPQNPDLTIDTTDVSPTEAAQEVLLYLAEKGYIR